MNIEDLEQSLIIHRGLINYKYPENTIESFKETIKKGYTIELDVHLIKDNNIIVYHDDDFKRLCNSNLKLKNSTIDDINKLRINNKYKIPLFKDVLELVDGTVPLVIELKYDRFGHKLEKEIVKYLDNYKGKFCIKSFNPFIVRWFYKHRKNYLRGFLLTDNGKTKDYRLKFFSRNIFIKYTKANFLSCNANLIIKNKLNKYIYNYPIILWNVKNIDKYNKIKNKCNNIICEDINNFK